MTETTNHSPISKVIAALEDTVEGIANGIKKLQYPGIYVSITIGFLIFYYSLQLHVVIEEQENKWNSNLKTVDHTLILIVDGINKFLIETPEKAQALFNGWLGTGNKIMEKTCTLFTDVANSGTAIDFDWFVEVINSYMDYVSIPASIPSADWNPDIKCDPPRLENFISFGNLSNTGILVPKIPFSAYKTLHPAVDRVAGTGKTIVEVTAGFGFLVFLVGVVPILLAIILPFHEGSRRCGMADFFIFQMIWRGIKTLLKWRIFIPLLIGGCLCFASISLAVLVKKAESKMIPPLQEADRELAKFIDEMNDFTTGFSAGLINFTNDSIDEVNKQTYNRLVDTVSSLGASWIRALSTFQNDILDALNAPFKIHSYPEKINIPKFSILQRIPDFNTSVMAIPDDLISLEAMLSPVIQRMLDVPLVICYWLWILGLSIAVIPAATLVCNILYPLLPTRLQKILEGKSRQRRLILQAEEVNLPDIMVETPGPSPTVTPDTTRSPTPSPSKLSNPELPLPSLSQRARCRRSLSFGAAPLNTRQEVELLSLDSNTKTFSRVSNVQRLASMFEAKHTSSENRNVNL